MEIRRCAAGGHAFRPRPQVPNQRYCSAAACQRERRRRWQREKRESDADYCENQARAQRHSVRGRKIIANTGASTEYLLVGGRVKLCETNLTGKAAGTRP